MDSMRVVTMMILLSRNSTLTKQHLQTPWIFSCQLDNLKSTSLPNLVCWIVSKNDGKLSVRCAQFPMETL